MKISFNPSNSNKNILDLIKNNKDIIFDLKGHSIFARGVEFKGTDTNTWRPVVDNLTSDSTTSSLSAKQGKVLKALIDGKSNSDHNHDGRYVKKSGDTMQGVLTIDTTNFGALTIKRNDDANGASIQFRGKSSVYGYIGLNNSTKDKQFLRWSSDTSRIYTILDTSSTYISNGKGVINGTTITQVDNATNSTNSTNARKLVGWYPARPTSLNAQFGDGSLRIFYATSSTTEGKPAEDAHILHLAWDTTGGWDVQLAVHTPSGKVSTRAQNGGTWQPWKTLAFTTDIPSSLKNPYSFNVFGVVYDGSAAKTVTTSNFISQVNEGTSTITDGTMLITSYASNSGFADTNAVNVPYKRKAIHLWEYIKAKTDSLYATNGHNHDGRYVRAFGTSNDNIDSDWGQSFKTFDPIPLGTPPEKDSNNISLLSIGENFNRRKQLAFIWSDDNIYYRRHTDSGFTNWRRLAFANEIPTSLKNPYALTISLNGTSQGPYDGSAAKNINITPGSIGAAVSNHSHDYLVVNSADDKSFNSAYHNFQVLYAGGGNGITGKPANVDAFGLFKFRAASGWSGQMLLANGGSLYIRSSEDAKMTNTLAWKTILDSSNYSGILDSRYYTELEVNSLLSRKLDRVNLTTGSWNPRGYHLAADYHYNGGDLSISESGGQIHVSVDGYFWQNEGQYRVLDTSDVAGLKSNLTVHQYLSATDVTWYPLIWGGDSHKNTSDSTGAVYKSYDILSWQTSSQTLYATNIQTNNIKNLSIGGGIYWNPNVESASDGSDAASITLARSGVAGGTTLVLSQMNDTNDTIQFKTNTAARLYHNNYPILTTQNTYVSNNKGYINGTEITQVNNSDTLDNWHKDEINRTLYITSETSGLSSYWAKLWEINLNNQYNDVTITFLAAASYYPSYFSIFSVYLRQHGIGTSKDIQARLVELIGNIAVGDTELRLYVNNTTGNCQLWGNVKTQFGTMNLSVLKKAWRTATDSSNIGTFFSTSFDSVQSLPGDGWHKVGVIQQGVVGAFNPAAHTHTVFKNNLMIKGTNGISDSASIHLGIGDSDTGFKWISNGVCQIYADNAAVGQWTSGGMNWFKNPTVNGNKVWNAGNDGSGSGLDADTLDGIHLNGIFTGFSYAQSRLTATIGTVSKTVNVTGSYPSIGGVTMNTIASYGNCMGMADLASSNSNVNPNNQTSWHHFINMSYNTESTSMWQTQFAIKAGTTEVWVRSRAGGSISDSSAWTAPWVRLARITDNIASATNADMVDGYHENSFLRYRGATYTDQEATLWSQIGIKQYDNALPDNLTGVYNYGSVISLPGFNSRFEIYASHYSSNGNGLYYRSGWYNDKKAWLKFIDSSNIGSQSVNYANSAGHANSAGNADTLGGIPRNYGQAPFGTIPFIGNGGVMEIGRYIDFHFDNSGSYDYSTRIQATGDYKNIVNLPSASGTLALTSYGGDDSTPIFLGCLDLYHGNDGTISSSFHCLGYSVPFTYTRGGNYCKIVIPDTTRLSFYIIAAIASVNYSRGGMDTWVGEHRGDGAWWLHCQAFGENEVRVKGFRLANSNNDSWWGGNPLYSGDGGANKITVCIFGCAKYK